MNKEKEFTGMHAHKWSKIFDKEFEDESDRAAVIISASMLERALETLLRSYLIPVSGSSDSLFDGAYSPISSFSAKIDLSYRSGLISNRFARDLHIIRRIRNEFAHDVKKCKFESPHIRDRIIELNRSSHKIKDEQLIKERFPEGARGDFQSIVSWMLFWLNFHAENIEPLECVHIEFGYLAEKKLGKEVEKTDEEKEPDENSK